MSGEPKTHTLEEFHHRHPVEAIRFTGANASDIYKFVGWEVPGDRVRLDNKAGVMRLWTAPPIHAGDWLVRRPQPLHKSEAACRPRRYVVYTDVDFHATFEPVGVPVVARDEAAELRAENEELRRIAKHALSALGTWVSFGQREAAREEIERDLRRLAGGENEK